MIHKMHKGITLMVLLLIFSSGLGAFSAPVAINVVMDNASQARPQTGIEEARMVYELVVAPGITRYLALFDSYQRVEEIGPIRSARLPFLEIASGHGGVIVHCGASVNALYSIPRMPVESYDEIYNAKELFYRTPNRRAPHNLYTGMDLIVERILSRSPDNQIRYPYSVGPVPQGGRTAEEVWVRFLWQRQDTGFVWDKESGKYYRHNAGIEELDSRGEPLTASNVIILYTQYTQVPINAQGDVKGVATTLGEGKASFYRDGMVWEGSWSREQLDRPFSFSTSWGPMIFAPGSIWILVVQDQ